jgi:hypothetical protein
MIFSMLLDLLRLRDFFNLLGLPDGLTCLGGDLSKLGDFSSLLRGISLGWEAILCIGLKERFIPSGGSGSNDLNFGLSNLGPPWSSRGLCGLKDLLLDFLKLLSLENSLGLLRI